MTLRHLLPILLLPLAVPRLEAAEKWGIDQHTLLYAIGEVERNPWRRPGGLYGYTAATWRQYSRLPYRMAQNPAKAKETRKGKPGSPQIGAKKPPQRRGGLGWLGLG